jgi:hypothetical protein
LKDEKAVKFCQKKVTEFYNKMYAEGYFRDSYNSWNLLWQFDMDYWTTITQQFTTKGEMTPQQAKELLAELKNR